MSSKTSSLEDIYLLSLEDIYLLSLSISKRRTIEILIINEEE